MSKLVIVLIVLLVVILFGVVVFPIVNKAQFKRMPFDQQIRILMKQSNKLIYWKNVSYGSKGSLFYIKNKRKILAFPWALIDGKMLCTKDNPFECWDYPEDKPKLNPDEVKQLVSELQKYNSKSVIKLYFKD